MADIIIKTKDGEVIPAIQPDAFGLAVQSMEKLDQEMGDIEKRARELPKRFDDKATYDKAGALVAQKKSVVKLSESTMTPFTELVKKVKTFIDQQKNIVKNHGEQIDGILAPAMAEYNEREARLAREEEQRKQAAREAELKRENEETARKNAAAAEERKKERIDQIRRDLAAKKITKRQAEKFLREAGANEEAEKARIAADKDDADAKAKDEAAKLKVKPRTGATAGVRRHTIYKAECYDQDMYKAALQIAWVKQDFQLYERLIDVMEVSDQKLSEKAREIMDDEKMMALYPFVKATHEDKF